MRRLIASLIAVVALAACSSGSSSTAKADREPVQHRALGLSCGVERWAVKTGQDPGALRVNLTPVNTSIPALDALPRPPGTLGDTRAAGEFRTVRVFAHLTAYKLEGDSDIHLILTDRPTGKTMIAEIPLPECAPHSAWASQLAAVRAKFPAPSSTFTNVDYKASVVGVVFFDFLHGQSGVAPNGVEIHPVLAISITP